MPRLHARALKCSVVLSADEIIDIGDPPLPRVTLNVTVQDFGTVSADITAKSVRKAQAVIAEHGANGVACVLQGKLVTGNRLIEAGLVALQLPKPIVAQAAA